MKKQTRSNTTAPNPVSASGGLWFAPVEPRAAPGPQASPRQAQYAWEMTLEQFQQAYFPELCAKPNEAESTSQREAA